MNKITPHKIALTSLIFGLAQNAVAECTMNGKPVSCEEMWHNFGWVFGAFGIFFFLVTGFWIWMLVNCLKSSRSDKLVWTLVLLFGSIVGAILYFFIAKDKEG